MNHYVITGLPRSRSSWLANLMTYQDSFCFHEISNMAASIPELVQILKMNDWKYSGTADCIGLFYYEALCDGLGYELPLVIVERDPGDVIGSMFLIFGRDFSKEMEKNLLQIEYLKKYFSPLVVKFKDLDQIKTVGRIWNYCVNTNMDVARFLQLDRMTIQPHLTKYQANLDLTNSAALCSIPRKNINPEGSA